MYLKAHRPMQFASGKQYLYFVEHTGLAAAVPEGWGKHLLKEYPDDLTKITKKEYKELHG